MRDWLRQEVINEIDARRRNEWIEQTNASFGADEAADDYVCECSDPSCTTSINLTRDEYESVRKDGTYFAIAINHENPLVDRVIAESGQFAVVEKWVGPGRRIAYESNPRR